MMCRCSKESRRCKSCGGKAYWDPRLHSWECRKGANCPRKVSRDDPPNKVGGDKT